MTSFEAYAKLCEAAGVLDEMLSTTDPKLARGVVARMQNTPTASIAARKGAVDNLRTAQNASAASAQNAMNRVRNVITANGGKPSTAAIGKVVNRSGSFQASPNHYSTVLGAAQRLEKRGNI